ncbi:taste receptor type 2 member 9-like [Hyperolius riggenbachi]|uniref:taste receptor type 2 member 9-like n=1 Tax=Hyperolius riggenbachi TaxID=752182 RepID=UPI0035A37A39
MYSILQKGFTALLLAECFVGITINVFIAAVQIRKWKAVRSLDSCDQILLCLGISRSFSLINVSLDFIIRTFFPLTYEDLIFYSVVAISKMLLYYISFWLTTILCVFYCVKIANYNNPLFLYMKTRISRLVPRLIVASLLISLAFTLPILYYHFHLHQQNSGNNFGGNVTMGSASLEKIYQIQSLILILGTFLPFLVFCEAISLLIQSLWLHTRQMRSSGTSFQSPKLEAHFSVVKSMTLFLCCQTIHFGCSVSMLSIKVYFASLWKVIFYITICAPSCLHSLYMVYSNTKLKQAFVEMCNSFQRLIEM